jgi:hypothetical protein
MRGVWSFGTLAGEGHRPGWGLGREGYARAGESQIWVALGRFRRAQMVCYTRRLPCRPVKHIARRG